ncbi:hypothetical protein [Actinoplanes sp. GCM10030250]|uniref:hypothetical protein n=1 Tax=Actinoplanes sp. GCM10030250 TaxID=3273376 RepID=UPI00361611A5
MSWLLVPHLVRAVPWWPLVGAVSLAILAQLPLLAEEPSGRAVLTGLWLAAGVLGAAAAFALPDGMASTVITPVPRWVRQWLRTGLVVLPAGVVWALLYMAARHIAGPEAVGDGLVAGAGIGAGAVGGAGFVVLQAAVCGLLPVAVAAIGARYRDTASGALFGPVAQGMVLVGSLFFSDRASPWSVPGAGEWTTAHRVWPVALVLVLGTLLWGNREPT